MIIFTKQHIMVFFLSIVMCIVGYIGIIAYCVNFNHIQPVFKNTHLWLKYGLAVKDAINDRPTHKKRILVMGGSNNLFGFNGAMIEANTNYAFINYGIYGGIPVNYKFDRIMQHAKDGDIIFISFAFDGYKKDEPIQNSWYINNILSWDKTYTKYISYKQKLQAYTQFNFFHTQSRFLSVFMPFVYKELVNNKDLQQFITDNLLQAHNIQVNNKQKKNGDIITIPCQAQTFNDYHYKSLSPTGDFCLQSGSFMLNEKDSYLDTNLQVSQFFLDEYARLQEFADKHNIKLFLIYPPTMENPLFSLNDKETFAKIENLNTQLSKHNIHFVGDFRDFHFERKYFYDTSYHLNSEGVTLRTTNFIKLLRELEKNGEIP